MKNLGCVISVIIMIFFPIIFIFTSRSFLNEKTEYLKLVNEVKKDSAHSKIQKITNQAQLIMGTSEILYSETPTLIVENPKASFKEKKIVLKKVDQESRVLLSGAVFDIENEQRELVKQAVKIPESGEVTLELAPGNYYLIEKKAPKGYHLFDTPILLKVK